jgi:hypothetical protein
MQQFAAKQWRRAVFGQLIDELRAQRVRYIQLDGAKCMGRV